MPITFGFKSMQAPSEVKKVIPKLVIGDAEQKNLAKDGAVQFKPIT